MTQTYLVARGQSGTYPVQAESPEQAVALMDAASGAGWSCVGLDEAPKSSPAYTYSWDVAQAQMGRDRLDEGQ